MNDEKLKPNDLKILIYLLKQLEKRIYLLRLAFYGEIDKYFPDGILVSKEKLEMENNDFETKYNISTDDYRLLVESCEIEACIRRIRAETAANMKNCKSLKDVIVESEDEATADERNQKMLESLRKQIGELKEVLSVLQEEAQETSLEKKVTQKREEKKKGRETKTAEVMESYNETDFLKKLMAYKIESKKSYYEHKQVELQESIERFKRETSTQGHADVQMISFWLVKYDDYTVKLDMLLKQIFDNWSAKQRELNILKKYRKLNLEKIEKLLKLISERENYIEEDRLRKEMEQKKMEEEARERTASVTIQAFWRGAMVRKQMGSRKVKKPKKGKGKKDKVKKK